MSFSKKFLFIDLFICLEVSYRQPHCTSPHLPLQHTDLPLAGFFLRWLKWMGLEHAKDRSYKLLPIISCFAWALASSSIAFPKPLTESWNGSGATQA